MIVAKYGGLNPFDDLAPTPVVGRSNTAVSVGGRWAQLEQITLNGVITGNCESFSSLYSKTISLESNFATGFQEFSLYDEDASSAIYSAPYSVVRSISFEDSVYTNKVPFSVVLDSYPEELFSGSFGVLDPSRNISFSQQTDNKVVIRNNVSARGFNTDDSSGNALSNAINFVQQYTGIHSQTLQPLAVSPSGSLSESQVVLLNVSENIDRNSSSYSVTEEYLYDPDGNAPTGVLAYSVDIGGKDQYREVVVNGTINGGLSYTGHQLRASYNAIDTRALADNVFSKYYSGSLSSQPDSVSVTENGTDNILSFSCSFSDSPNDDPYVVETFSIGKDHSKGVSCLDYNANFISRNSLCDGGWDALTGLYRNYDFYAQAASKWQEYSGSGYLVKQPKSVSVSEDRLGGTVGVQYSFCNESGSLYADCLKDVQYSLGFDRTLKIRKEFALLEEKGNYVAQGITNKWSTFSIQGSAGIKSSCSQHKALNEVSRLVGDQRQEYAPKSKYMLSQSLDTGIAGKISFNASWTQESDFNFVTPESPPVYESFSNGWELRPDGFLHPVDELITEGMWAANLDGDMYLLDPSQFDEDWSFDSTNVFP